MRPRHALVLFAVLVVTLVALKCSPVYIVRAGFAEARILARRRPIPEVAADPSTPATVRAKLEQVEQARTFAAKTLHLDVGDSYTTFSKVDHDTLLMVLSAAERDRFVQLTWWFPIVGRVPYKGYFDFDEAYDEAAKLEAKGFDAYVRPSSAFSTLGWFNDPLLSTILRYDDVSLVSTVIHETTHNTLYLAGQAAFDESFASFVGDRGAAAYFCGVEGPEGERCRTAQAIWRDTRIFGAFLSGLVAELEDLYGRTDLSRTEKLTLRQEIFDRAQSRFRDEVQPRLRVLSYESFLTSPLNNATLIARRLYYDRLDLFEAAYRTMDDDLPGTIAAIVRAAKAHPDDPYDALAALSSGS